MDGEKYVRHVVSLLNEHGVLGIELEYRVSKAMWKTVGRSFIPFDISYYVPTRMGNPLPHREYIECKYHAKSRVFPAEVGKFIEDLRVCGIPMSRAAVVTNNGYQKLARDYGRREGLRLYVVPLRRIMRASAIGHLVRRPIAATRWVLDALNGLVLPEQFERIA